MYNNIFEYLLRTDAINSKYDSFTLHETKDFFSSNGTKQTDKDRNTNVCTLSVIIREKRLFLEKWNGTDNVVNAFGFYIIS